MGIIKKIDINKGFGFIKLLDGTRDIYFKIKNIKNKKNYLDINTFVTFEVQQYNNKKEAIKIEKV